MSDEEDYYYISHGAEYYERLRKQLGAKQRIKNYYNARKFPPDYIFNSDVDRRIDDLRERTARGFIPPGTRAAAGTKIV